MTETPDVERPRRCDLHVHSKRSDRPSEWYLAQIGAPESFTEPLEVYRTARDRGMDFVTIADHDTIRGALEIAHLPGTFLSCEVTAAFPEDGAEIHLLVWGIGERDHEEIDRLRGDLYDLRRYLRSRAIPHAVAHPLFRVGDRLGLDHLERLLLLFSTFELVNGQREARDGELFRAVAEAVDPALLAAMAERQGLASDDLADWPKRWVGGSDDHGGLSIATTWTETPATDSVAGYLQHLRAGAHAPGGEHGSSLKLARSLQALAHDYYRRRVLAGSRWRNDPLAELLAHMAAGEMKPGADSVWGRSLRAAASFLPPLAPPPSSAALARRADRRRKVETARAREAERAVFESSCRFGHRALARAADGAVAALERGQPMGVLATLPTLASAGVALAPYLAAFRFEHVDEPFRRAVARRFRPATVGHADRTAWATDTLFDVNGVGRTIRSTAALAHREGRPLTVFACGPRPEGVDFELEMFPAIWERPLPGYERLALRLPPVVEMIELIERERYSRIVVSTPGPVGLTALWAATLLGLPTTGLYHTDFPRYVEALGGDARFGGFVRRYLAWFYGRMGRVLVSSAAHRDQLQELGIPTERIGDLPHGVDSDAFHPRHRLRNGAVDERRAPLVLYVGRLSPEKNLDVLLAAFEIARASCPGARLALVGDGPARERLERVAGGGVSFLGELAGDELARAYASADLFAFPSRTDTFGNAVLEALASGLPVLAALEGGPAEQVIASGGGILAPADRAEPFGGALARLLDAPELRDRLGRNARRWAERQGWDRLLDALVPASRPEAAHAAASPPPRAPRAAPSPQPAASAM